jgi:hypothetical protein
MADLVPRASREELEAREAHLAQERIKTIVRAMRRSWIELAGHLYHFHQHRYWKALGHDSIGDWLADPDIDIQWRYAYEMIQIYRIWIDKRDMEDRVRELPVSKLQVVSGAVEKGRIDPEEALADVESLSRGDLRERYNGLSTIEDKLEATEETAYFRCHACGSRVRRRMGDG